jgi:hypothetical protein
MSVHLARFIAADGNRNFLVGPVVVGEDDERPLGPIPDQSHLDAASTAARQIDEIPHAFRVVDASAKRTGRGAEEN